MGQCEAGSEAGSSSHTPFQLLVSLLSSVVSFRSGVLISSLLVEISSLFKTLWKMPIFPQGLVSVVNKTTERNSVSPKPQFSCYSLTSRKKILSLNLTV